MRWSFQVLVGVIMIHVSLSNAFAVDIGTAFTYQGSLENGAGLVTDTCDFRFGLWDAAVGGSQIGNSPHTEVGVEVTDGIFTTLIDFGPAGINGTARWLRIEVKCPGDFDFTSLSPRVALTPAPHALALPGFYTRQPVVVNPEKNENQDQVEVAGGIAGVTTPNIIGGWERNTITDGVVGGTISGGGNSDHPNSVTDDYGTVSGGAFNSAGNGAGTTSDKSWATVGGGYRNSASGSTSTASGGYLNSASGESATVGGGDTNSASGNWATVGGGGVILDFLLVCRGGSNNGVGCGQCHDTLVGRVVPCEQDSDCGPLGPCFPIPNVCAPSGVCGGATTGNLAAGQFSAVGGGGGNQVPGDFSTIGGGYANQSSGSKGVVGGGYANHASGTTSTVGGGRLNVASGYTSSVAGGDRNVASGSSSTVAGGDFNIAGGYDATVPGGYANRAGGNYSFAAGSQAIVRDAAAVGGGNTTGDQGTFVWSDAQGGNFISSAPNQFLVRAEGGVGINTNEPAADLHVAGKVKAEATVNPATETVMQVKNNGTAKAVLVDAKAGWLEAPDPQGQGGIQNNAVEITNDGFGRCIQTVCRVPDPNGNAEGHVCVSSRVVLYDPNSQDADRAPDISPERFAAGQGEGYAAATPAVIGPQFASRGGGGPPRKPVVGYIADADDIGVWASVPYAGGRGVQAHARHGIGVYGSTNMADFPDGEIVDDPNAIGVKGYSYTGTGVVGESPNGMAGQFIGDLEVTGIVHVNGTGHKIVSDAGFEVEVAAGRALRIESNPTSPNLIEGHAGNSVQSSVVGATIGGGGSVSLTHQITDDFGTVGGGEHNTAGDGAGTTSDKRWATVSGGADNTASGVKSSVGGGGTNVASALGSTISGGNNNSAAGTQCSVGGGALNNASGGRATIAGGYSNLASGVMSCVGGGWTNQATGELTTVGGGVGNVAAGFRSVVPGGENNSAGGAYSFAAGFLAKVRDATASGDANGDEGTFVWSDASSVAFTSTGPNQFLIRASGGVGINRNNPTSPLQIGTDASNGNGAFCSTGGMWTNGSDRNSKQDFEEVDKQDILTRVTSLPVTRWRYKGEPAVVRHIGPVAQDFYASFGTGDSDRFIGTIDADGVALAAIQGLHQIVMEKECEINELRLEISELKEMVIALSAKQSGGDQ